MKAGDDWLGEVLSAALEATSSRQCAARFVQALRDTAGAWEAFVFGRVPGGTQHALVAGTHPVPRRATVLAPLGGAPLVHPGESDFGALAAFAGRGDGVFLRLPVNDATRLLVLLPAEPTTAEVVAYERAAHGVGRLLSALRIVEREKSASSPPVALTPHDSSEFDEPSGVWTDAARSERDRRRAERFLENVIENIPDMIFVKDATELRFVRFNLAGERLLGWPREMLLGKNDYDFFPASEADFFTGKDRQVLQSGQLLDIPEEPIHTANGERFLHTKKIPIFDEAGEPLYLLGISEDITEKKLTREALRQREQRYQNLFHHAPVSLWELDCSGARLELDALQSLDVSISVRIRRIYEALKTLSVNEATLRIFGAESVEQLQGRLPDLLGMGSRGGSLVEALLELSQAPGLVEREISGRRLDDAPLHLLMRVTVPESGSTDLSYVLLSLVDITALKTYEEALSRTAEDLRRSNNDLQQFAYVASHDLQEPLRVIVGFSELLRKAEGARLSGESREFLDFIVDASSRMQRLIRDLLAYARVETQADRTASVSLSEPLAEALANLRVALEESGGEVVVSPDPLPLARIDAGQLAQVFQNLIGNALKFRSEAPPRIHVHVGRTGPTLQVAVSDNGIGFAPEYSARIFEIFQRLHTAARYPGTGIGLALCKKIIERHGGSISAESAPGQGATFRFTLPVGRVRP